MTRLLASNPVFAGLIAGIIVAAVTALALLLNIRSTQIDKLRLQDSYQQSPLSEIDPEFYGPTEDHSKQLKAQCRALGVLGKCTQYESILKDLLDAPFAYNRPNTMWRDEPTSISAILDPGFTIDPADALAGQEGDIVQVQSKISRYMSAELSGAVFQVEPTGPQRRLITTTSPTQWNWKATPLKSGSKQLIVLQIFAHIQENGEVSDPITIRTFPDYIRVNIKTWDQMIDVVKDIQPVHAFLVAVSGSVSGLFVWYKRRGVKKGIK
jgi:hypothetical protein